MTTTPHQRILIVDDNPSIHDDFRKILSPPESSAGLDAMEDALFGPTKPRASRESYELDSAGGGQEALEKVVQSMQNDRRYALAFVDMRMPPGWDGLETIEKLWQVDSDIQMVICTAYSDYSWEEINARGTDLKNSFRDIFKYGPVFEFRTGDFLVAGGQFARA